MHRVRMLLPFFKENGWEVQVLAVSPEQVAAPLDPWLLALLPADVVVHRVHPVGLKWSWIPGLGTLGLRALRALARGGDRLLATSRFDLVYFSTTVFEVHLLGSHWKRKYGVPFVMDYQDPWVNGYYREHPQIEPPGGRLKYAVVDLIHKIMESAVLRQCAGITSVSPEYPKQLFQRYPWFRDTPHLVQPFPGAQQDFERLGDGPAGRRLFDPADGKLHWVYVGRGGPDMKVALRGFFMALRDHLPKKLRRRLRVHFIGTSYAPSGTGKKSMAGIADEFGLGYLVEETPDRISYEQALWSLKEADALIVPGSDDPAYTASKIYPYLLAGRPMLAIFHEESTVVDLIRKVGGAVSVSFTSNEPCEMLAERIARDWLSGGQYARTVALDERAFEPYTDRGSAVTLCQFLRQTVSDCRRLAE